MEEEFDVRGRHEDLIDRAAEHRVPLAQRVALFSAVLASLGAVVSFLAGHTQNEALYHKDEAVLLKAKASDQWAYFQAESEKQHLAGLAAELVPPTRKENFEAQVRKYAQKKAELQRLASTLDKQADQADRLSEESLSPHNKLALSMSAIQIAIALASIAALTRRGWLLTAAAIAGAGGIALLVAAWLPT